MSADSEDVKHLRLLGETLPIKAGGDDELLHEAYELVEEQLETIDNKRSISSSLKQALLCSINLAGELIKLRRSPGKTGLQPETVKRIEDLRDQLQTLQGNDQHGST